MDIFILREGRQFGPFSKKELRLRLALKYFESNLWAWHTGLPEWKALYEVIPLDSVPKHPDIYSCSEECKEGGIATLRQLNYLRSLGVEYPYAISKQEAGALLGAHASRVTAAQKQRLEFYGVSAAGMTKESASRCLDELNELHPEKEEEYFRWLDKRREEGSI
jgi:hypothetical protein